MASKAHCAYCFETLVAHFERRQPLRLEQVQELWEQYHGPPANDAHGNDKDEDIGEDDGQYLSPSDSSAPSTSSTSVRSSNTNTPTSSSASSRSSLAVTSAFPLFVTWNTLSRSSRKSLRGCIGTFEAQELEDGLQSYALTSALDDTRFSPVPPSELPALSCHVTLLTNFSAPKQDPMDWVLGKHGIRISFSHRGRQYGSTYLPDVAPEQGWSKDEALISLMRKAGWNGSSREWERAWQEGRGKLVTYEGAQVGITYKEWKEWRDWVHQEHLEG